MMFAVNLAQGQWTNVFKFGAPAAAAGAGCWVGSGSIE